MNITRENIDALNTVVKIELKAEDYLEKVNNVLHDYRKQAKMPGFRPGKVPLGMIKKMYGKAVKAEEINKVLSDSLNGYIQEKDLQVLGNPMPKDEENPIDVDSQEEFVFSYRIGLAPEFSVNISDKDKFIVYDIQVDDKLIDKQVGDLTKRYGNVERAEVSEENDMLQGEFVELDEQGEIKEAGIMHTSTISLEYLEDTAAKKPLVGLKVDEIAVIDPKKVSKGDTDMAAMLGIEKEQVGDINTNFNFKVTKIYRMKPAEVNQEFFNKLFGEGTVTTNEEFRSKVGEEAKKSLSAEAEKKLQSDIAETLIDKMKLSLPDEFLKEWLLKSNDKEFSEEQVEKEYPDYAKALRWQLIENKIIKENDLNVEHDEALEHAKILLHQQMMQYGYTETDPQQLDEMAHKLIHQEEEARKIYRQLYDQKLTELFKSTFKLKPKEVTYDEFVKLASEKPKSGLLSKLGLG